MTSRVLRPRNTVRAPRRADSPISFSPFAQSTTAADPTVEQNSVVEEEIPQDVHTAEQDADAVLDMGMNNAGEDNTGMHITTRSMSQF